MAAAYAAGAANLPFAVLRGYRGTDLAARTRVAAIECPFTGEELAAVPALRPDVGIVHAQQADERGNVQLWGITGVQKEVVLASRALARDRRGDRRRSSSRGPAASSCRAGRSRRSRSPPAAPIPRTRTATTTATTRSTSSGTRSAATASASRVDAASTCSRRADIEYDRERAASRSTYTRRGDDGRRGRAAARATASRASSGSARRAAPRTSRGARTRPAAC